MSLSFLVSTLLLQQQAEPIGELSKLNFLRRIAAMSYRVVNLKNPHLATVTDGETTIHVVMSFHSHGVEGEPFVGMATGRVEFDLPRYYPKEHLRDWKAREKLDRMTAASFLGGRVILENTVARTESSQQDMKANIQALFSACRNLKHMLQPRGAKLSDQVYQMGKVPLNLQDRLLSIDPEDIAYLRKKLKWGNELGAGSSNGWCIGAEPLGVPVYFNAAAGGFGGCSLSSMVRPDPGKLKRFKPIADRIEWAQVLVQDGFVHLQTTLDLSRGKTVQEVRSEVLDFAARVKSLNLF